MNWLRLYVEITRDLKLRPLPPAERWVWIAVLILARQSSQPGRLLLTSGVPVTEAHLADEASVSIEDVRSAVASFAALKMLQREDGVFVVTNWRRRQFASDTSTPRTRGHRERSRNVPETAPDTDTDTDTDTESDPETEPGTDTPTAEHTGPAEPGGSAPSPPVAVKAARNGKANGYSPEFERFWAAYPRKAEKHAAALQFERRVKGGTPARDLFAAALHLAEHAEEQGTEERFIPHAATFLGPQRKFEDFVEGVPRASRGPPDGRVPEGWHGLRRVMAERQRRRQGDG